MRRFELDDEILSLYEVHESAYPVAEKLGCSTETVYRVLKKHGVPRTHRHPKPEKPKRKLVEIDVAEAVRMYYCGMGAPKIAEEFGCSAQAVRVRLIDAGVEFRNGGSPKCEVNTDEIRRLYLAGMNQKDIAERMGVSIFVVSRRIRQLGLSQKKRRRNITLPMDEVVARFEAGETLDELAGAFGCHRETIRRRLKAAGIIAEERTEHAERCVVCGAEIQPDSRNIKYCDKCSSLHRGRKHSARARKYGVEYESGITWRTLSERLGHCNCQICGEPCDPTDKRWGVVGPRYPSVDCIVPMSKGGGYTWDNVQLAHCECNCKKSDRTSGGTKHADHDRRDGKRHALGAAENAGLGHRSVNRCRGRKPQHGAAGAAVPRDDTRNSRAAGGIR